MSGEGMTINFEEEIEHFKPSLEVEEVGNWAAVLCSELGLATTGSNISITCGQVQL